MFSPKFRIINYISCEFYHKFFHFDPKNAVVNACIRMMLLAVGCFSGKPLSRVRCFHKFLVPLVGLTGFGGELD